MPSRTASRAELLARPGSRPAARHVRRRAGRRPAWWLLYALAGTALSLVVITLPGMTGEVLWDAVPAASLAVMVIAIRRHRPAAAAAWWLMVAGLAVWFGADLLWTAFYVALGDTDAVPAWTGLVYVAAYPLLAAGLARLARGVSRPWRSGATLDALFVVTGLAYLYWNVVFGPQAAHALVPGVNGFLIVAYPLLDLLLLFMVARLWLLTDSGSPAYLLLGLGCVAVSLGDATFAVTQTGFEPVAGNAAENLSWLIWYVLMAAAALHPSMRGARGPGGGRLTLRRGLVFVVVVCAGPLSVLFNFRPGRADLVDVSIQLGMMIALVGFLIMRMVHLTGVAERRAEELDRRAGALRASLAEQHALQEALTHQALHDPLTGLANRSLFRDRLEQAAARRPTGASSAVLLLDLDGFKDVNDTHGHPAGDQLLVQVGRRLRELLREADTLARLGGDEFAILLEGVTLDESADIAGRVVDALARPCTVDGAVLHVTTSVGLYMIEHRTDPSDVLRDADLALYAAKAAGKNRISVFHAGLRVSRLDHARIVAGLRRALAEDAFSLAYQPVVDMGTGRVQAVEALLRWDSPDGPVPPEVFVPIAEDNGLIVPIGVQVLRRACHEALRWYERHGVAVTVNVSSRQLRSADFVDTVLAVLRDSGLPGEALILEITETALLASGPQKTAQIIARLTRLRSHGVRVAIDDFGTGYSSLAYLLHLPVDLVKIDGAFTASDPGDDAAARRRDAFVQAILSLCESLELQAVAEQVETVRQRELLRSLHCPLGQGYLFARPLTAAGLDALLEGAEAADRAPQAENAG
ncbi:putative bifunctional diguanylate cyclase/phosphodiesterase [Spirillospora sp. CA-253888]